MNRRQFLHASAAAALPAFAAAAKFEPNWDSLKTHAVPEWFHDAKLGIFIHWGLYSVPAFAPPTGELGKVDWNTWFYKNPYAEWYLNSLRLTTSETAKRHAEKYGADFDYYRFSETFHKESEKWDPNKWADVIQSTGAGYAVLTTKHHDGFALWPSKVKHPKRNDLTTKRDFTGELTSAVRKKGLRMGLYYSGGLDWTFETKPVAKMADLATTAPKSQDYADYADAHWRELIERYEPAVLWNDISYPKLGKITEIFADYYNRFPEGLVNSRFNTPHIDFTTPEYTKYDKIVEKKWETCRGLGFSFGYNQVEDGRHVIAADKLVEMLIDIVSKNGNLLLNIGPKPDGSISEIQMDRLNKLGAWMKVNGEGIRGTRPNTARAQAKTSTGEEIRFTRKGETLYAFVFSRPASGVVEIPGLAKPSKVELLGQNQPLKVQVRNADVAVTLPPASGSAPFALGLKVTM
jgi:alpha-L-fucosidase